MRIAKEGNISPTHSSYTKTVSGYYTIWEIKKRNGQIESEKVIRINQAKRELSKKIIENTIEHFGNIDYFIK